MKLDWTFTLQLAVLSISSTLAPRLEAQLVSTVIQNARIITMNGPPIENGMIIIRGDRISAIGRDLDVPFLSRRIDAAGAALTPGLIDVYSSLGMTTGSSRTGQSTSRAEDGFDRYAVGHLSEALRNGVTAAYVSSRGAVGIHGTGAVIRLVPGDDGSVGEPLSTGSVLEIDLGSSRSPLARIATFESVRKQFRQALEYRRSREIYAEELEEYEKALKERARKKKKSDTEKNDTEKNDTEKKEGAQDERRNGVQRRRGNGQVAGTEASSAPETAEPPPEEKPDSSASKRPAKDDLKKPTEPKPDRRKDVLLRALDREIAVRVEAHRSADILNALDLKKEFSLDITLVGATDAYLLADEIAAAEVPVVLGDQLRSEVYTDGPRQRRNAEDTAALSRAGVDWWVGSGARSSARSRFVLLNAQIASAASGVPSPDDHALALVTSRAARLLNVADRIGRLARNLKADLVVWDRHPGDPQAVVRKVFVDGKLAYDAEVSP